MKEIIMIFLMFLSVTAVAADMEPPETPAEADKQIESQGSVLDLEEPEKEIVKELPIPSAALPELLSLEEFVIIPPRFEKGAFIWRVTIKNNNASPFKKDISIQGSQLSKGKWYPAGKVNISKLKGGQKRVALTNWSPVPEASELKIAKFYKEKDYAFMQKPISDLMP